MSELKPGDFIAGEYRVRRVFGGHGRSGMGVVYLVQGRTSEDPFVLKTFQADRADQFSLDRFRVEARTWVNLGKHPNIVQCHWVNEFAGQLYVAAEYVAPDSAGRNTLTQHLEAGSLSLRQQLHWISHFCFGMKHAMAHGLKAHRDIKPDNLMVDNRRRLKINDFGLAKGFCLSEGSNALHGKQGGAEHLTAAGAAFGTPPFMAPEQFLNSSAVDHRADIYSFGVVIYMMISGRLPITPTAGSDWASAHHQQRVTRLDHPLMSLAAKCLEKESRHRFQTYKEILAEVAMVYHEHDLPVSQDEKDARAEFERQRSLAMSLVNLDRPEEAIQHLKQMEARWPDSPEVFNTLGRSYLKLGRLEEALVATERALQLDQYSTADWNNLGGALANLGRLQEAQHAYRKALQIEPENTGAMIALAQLLMAEGQLKEAKQWCELAVFWRPEKDNVLRVASDCFSISGESAKAAELLEKLLASCPEDAIAWFKMGNALSALGQLPDALICYDRSIKTAPRTADVLKSREGLFTGVLTAIPADSVEAEAWNAKGLVLKAIGRPAEALACYETALAIEPGKADVWCNKGSALYAQGRIEEALVCLDKATSLNPRDFKSWCNRGVMLKAAGRLHDAVVCYDKALEINPHDLLTWGNKGNALGALGKIDDARKCFERILELDPKNEAARSIIEQIRKPE